MRNTLTSAAVVLALVGAAGSAMAQSQLRTQLVTNAATRPVWVTAPPGDYDRLFIVEQRGSAGVANRADIRILNLATNAINPTPFFSTASAGLTVTTGSEQGLLGLAFDPNFATNRRFYINFTTTVGGTRNVVRAYTVSAADPNVTDYASGYDIISTPDPFSNHNGGWIAFGPQDGFLYFTWGDGGSGGDPNGNSLNPQSLLGKMIRLDVSNSSPAAPYAIPNTNPFVGNAAFRQEIWSQGLRNSWRNDFDAATGELYMADVGQNAFEELNVEPALTGGRNYGWRCFEANNLFTTTTGPSGTPCPTLAAAQTPGSGWTFPVAAYGRTFGCSTTGGIVYRGQQIPWLRGEYFWSDYCNGWIRSFRYAGTPVAFPNGFVDRTAELAPGAGLAISNIVSFGRDANGEGYIIDQTGNEIFRLVPRCWANCDGSTSAPVLNALDFGCFLTEYQRGQALPTGAQRGSYANCDGSTSAPVLNALDFSCFLNRYQQGCQ